MVLGISSGHVFGLVMLAVGAVVLAVSARYVWRASAVYRATAVTDLGGAAPGALVRVEGRAERGSAEFLTAPFSGRDCLALRYAVEERRLSIYLLPWFVTIHEVAGSDAFRVRTPAATVDVVAPARTVTLDRHVVATVARDEDPPERIARYERHASAVPASTVWRDPPAPLRPLVDLLSLGTRRYTEQRAEPGDDVTVVGRVTDATDGVDPLVVSDRPVRATLWRMAKTSVGGLLAGGVGVALGVALLTV